MDNQQKLKSYQLLIEMVKKTTSTMESDSILQFILDGIIEVLPCVDVGVLFLYEKDKDLLKMVATHNIDFDDDYPYLKPGEGVSGKCFARKDCLALNSTEAFVNYIDCPSSYMRSFPESNKDYPYSAMSCSLMVENRAVGVVIVYNYNDEKYIFTDDDLELLSAAADHAAITISKSQLIKQKDYYLKQLEESNEALESTVEIQSNFTDIILNNNSFSNILEYLKNIIKGDVVLYDVFFQEIYRTGADQDIPIQRLITDNNLFKVSENQHYESIYYRHNDKLYIINPVIVQKNLIGFLIIFLKDRTINKKEEAVLNHASLVIALEWLKNDARTKSFSDFSNKFLDSVLKTPIDINAINYAHQLGLKNESDFCVAVIKNDFGDDKKYQDEIIKNLYIKNIINIVKSTSVRGIVFPRDDGVYIIFYSKQGNRQMIHDVERIEKKILDLNQNTRLIRGGLYNSLENIKKSYTDSQKCLKLITDYNVPMRRITYDSIGIWQLLLKLDKKDLQEYAYNILKNLLKEKTEKNKEFLLTLESYSNNNQNIKDTAKELNLHHNTIYFRIKKIEEILGIDFNSKNDWLNIQLACAIISKCNNIY